MNRQFKNFFQFIANRGISGILNGLFYAGLINWGWIVVGILFLFTGFQLIQNLTFHWSEMTQLNKWLAIVGIFVSLLSVVFVGLSFKFPTKWFSEIHGWTWLNQTAISGTLFISSKNPWRNVWWLLLAVSPSAFIQKIFINRLSGLPWDYVGTDVASGKYWSMKIFGKQIKVPRLGNMKIKLVIAIVCILTFVIINKVQSNKQESIKIERV